MGIPVFAGLGPVFFITHYNRYIRRHRQSFFLRKPAEPVPNGLYLVNRGLFYAEFDADTGGMPVGHRNAVTMGANQRPGRLFNHAVFNRTEYFKRLQLALFFLAADIGHHIINHVEARHPGKTRAAYRLHRRHKKPFDFIALLHQRPERHRITLNRTVGLDGDKPPLPAPVLLLGGNNVGVTWVHLWNQHRHIGRPAVCRGVGHDGDSGRGIVFFKLPHGVFFHFERGKNKGQFALRSEFGGLCRIVRVFDDEVTGGRRVCGRMPPFSKNRVTVPLTGAARGCRDIDHLKPGMLGKQRKILLPDHARRAEYANRNFIHTALLATLLHSIQPGFSLSTGV